MRALKTLKPIFYVVPIGIVAVLATVAYFATAGKAEADASGEQLQTATARRGTLSLMASGTGTLIPASEIELVRNERQAG